MVESVTSAGKGRKKRVFTYAERWAVFDVHKGTCYLCGKPVEYRGMHVDHVIPEHLEDDPDRLAEVKVQLGRKPDFDIQSFANLLPACGPCNQRKSGEVFEAVPIVLINLNRAEKAAAAAEKSRARMAANKDAARVLAALEGAISAGVVTEDDINNLLPMFTKPTPQPGAPVGGATEFLLNPFWKVISQGQRMAVVHARYGVGYTPVGPNPDYSFQCGHCMQWGPWQGARCMSCGQLSDPDD